MTITSTGQVSFSDIQAEFGGAATDIALSNYYSGGARVGAYKRKNNTIGSYVPTSGPLALTDFYATSAAASPAAVRSIIWGDSFFQSAQRTHRDSTGTYIYMMGYTSNGSGNQAYVSKHLASDLSIVWHRYLISPVGTDSYDSCLDSADNIIVVGKFYAGNSSSYAGQDIQTSLLITKWASNSTWQWSTRLGGQWDEAGYAVCVDNLDNIYVTGTSNSIDGSASSTNNNAIMAKYNSSGTLQWQRSLTSVTADYGRGICFSNSGYLYVTGTQSYQFGSPALFLAKYDTSGVLQWNKIIYSTGNTRSASMVANNDNFGVYISGYSEYPTSNMFLINVDSFGTVSWSRKVGTSSTYGYALSKDSSNNLYITGQGYTTPYGAADATIVKYNSSGVLQWVITGGNSETTGAGTYEQFSGAAVIGNYVYTSAQLANTANTKALDFGIYMFDQTLTMSTVQPPDAGSITLLGSRMLMKKTLSEGLGQFASANSLMTDSSRSMETQQAAISETGGNFNWTQIADLII